MGHLPAVLSYRLDCGIRQMNWNSMLATVPQIDDFPRAMVVLLDQHRPSRMPFFSHLAALPLLVASDPVFLGEVHLIYQAAMHATRAAVYYLPHPDSPALRKRKLQIFIDDDGLEGGDTHHYQLTRAFRNIGAKLRLEDEEFGSHEELCDHFDDETAHFVRLTKTLYARSLGPWCAVEMMSADWMKALADAFSVHFPQFSHEPYFEECFSHHVEGRHAEESLAVTKMVLRERPELLSETLRDAKMMAEALDGVWSSLDRVVLDARRRVLLGAKNGRFSAAGLFQRAQLAASKSPFRVAGAR